MLAQFGQTPTALRFTRRIHLQEENVDLTNLASVRALSRKLLDSGIPKLDAVILNAGIMGWIGNNWPLAFWQATIDPINATTWPEFTIFSVGDVTSPQLEGQGNDEPPLGQVFCSNVFGHYMLTHGLMPLLRACSVDSPGKIIWISSVDASAPDFSLDDFQGLESPAPYQHTKRMTDLLALTAANQPATSKIVNAYFDTSRQKSVTTLPTLSKPTIHVAHPGIVVTSIVPLMFFLRWLQVLTSLIARWLGSPWHNITVYSGANAPVWLALASPEEIKEKEQPGQLGSNKWGSAVSRGGTGKVEKTDVDKWGLDGSGSRVEWWGGGYGRKPGSKDATKEDVEDFIEEGTKVWREMEQLRTSWQERLDRFEATEAKA